MKRILLCIMLISCSIAISAQIQRLFFGLTLGVSTKNSVISYFKNNSIKYHIDDEGTYIANNIKFAGYKWPEVDFYFYKGNCKNRESTIFLKIFHRCLSETILITTFSFK